MSVDLKAERLNRGLNLSEAAVEIRVPLNVLQRAESGGSTPQPRNAKAIADFYGYKVTDIWPLDQKAAA